MEFPFGFNVDERTPPGVLPQVGVIHPALSQEEREAAYARIVGEIQEVCRHAVFDEERLRAFLER